MVIVVSVFILIGGTCVVGVERFVVIKMMLMCNATASTEYDRRRSGLPNTPLDIEYYNNNIE